MELEVEKDPLAALGERRDDSPSRGVEELQPDLIPGSRVTDPVHVQERGFQIGAVERDDEAVAKGAAAHEALPWRARFTTCLPARITPCSDGTSRAPIKSSTDAISARRR